MDFQKHTDVKFKHDEKLLAKAQDNLPPLYYQEVKPQRLVEIVASETGLHGFEAMESKRKLVNLPQYLLGKGEKLVLDFGNHYVGHLALSLDSVGSPMDAPLFLKVKFGEIPADIGANSADYDGWISSSWIQEEFLHIDELPTRLEMPRRYSFRYVELEVLDASPKWKLSVSAPLLIAQSSVTMSAVKSVATGDDLLDKIDQISLKTLQDCMQDVFEDGPKRDRRLWLGDLRLQALANYQTFGNQELVKRCLYLFAGMTTKDGLVTANVFTKPRMLPDDTFMLDYSLFFISVLSDFIEQNYDEDLLKDLYPVAKRQLELAEKFVGDDGLVKISEDGTVFVDWSEGLNKSTAIQAILIYTAKQLLQLAKLVHDEKNVAHVNALITKLSQAALEKCYNQDKHLFVSGDDQQINIASQAWMVLAHVLPTTEARRVMESSLKELFPVQGVGTPYMYHHIIAALFEVGLQDDAIREMKAYWGKMVELGADTFFEAFDPQRPNFSPYGNPIINSYCHAWSCTPTYLIRKYLVK